MATNKPIAWFVRDDSGRVLCRDGRYREVVTIKQIKWFKSLVWASKRLRPDFTAYAVHNGWCVDVRGNVYKSFQAWVDYVRSNDFIDMLVMGRSCRWQRM